MSPKYFLNICALCTLSMVFKSAINTVTSSINTLVEFTNSMLSFYLSFWESRNRNMKTLAYRKETHGSLILKWFRSQVEQVK